MRVTLLDAKEYAKVKGKEFNRQLTSYNMRKYTGRLWSNGWCPISVMKKTEDGNIYGRIANELVPTGIYNGITVTSTDKTAEKRAAMVTF